jgi:hypothetical protein
VLFKPYRRTLGSSVLEGVDRWLYRRATQELRSYPAVWRLAVRLARRLGGSPNPHVFRSACVLATLVDFWQKAERPRRVALIGDGDGFLGALLRRWLPEARLFCIDLPKMLILQARMHEHLDPAVRLAVTASAPMADVTLVLPQEVERIEGFIDCAINVSSMQEMRPQSIAAYFAFLRRRSQAGSHFYCVNRVEKQLAGGEVIRFAEYPWEAGDEIYLDGPCPYHRHFLSLDTLPDGPRWLGRRIPFVNFYDGPTQHRLAHLAPYSPR